MDAIWHKLSSLEVDLVTQVQIIDEAVCISLCANAFGKGMNPFILSLSMGK